jgi:copper chaperone CopZ
MKLSRLLGFASLSLVLVVPVIARAETTIELSKTHLCCPMCVKAVGTILEKIDGVTGKCDTKAKTITITAPNTATAQKAVDALTAAGFHGESSNKDVKVKDDSGAAKGKVKSLTVTGIHNCCRQCNTAIKKAISSVDGVKSDTCAAKETTFEVTGDFDAKALIKALNDAGYHAKVKK